MAGRTPRTDASPWVPEVLEPQAVARGIQECRGCDLYENATQGVPGAGPLKASIMLVGEQPGDVEDRQGQPFVGPAGKLLDRAIAEAGIRESEVFRTNAVKHFRWDPGRAGKRIHKGPSRWHVAACGPWMVTELQMVQPRGVVLLGATAGAAVFGPSFRVGALRGRVLEWPVDGGGPVVSTGSTTDGGSTTEGSSTTDGGSTTGGGWVPEWVVATVHPSSVLRSRQREEDYRRFVEDLGVVANLVG